MGKPHMPRLPGDEFIDEIHIRTIPRLKESHVIGDEWRTSTHVTALRKGRVVGEQSWNGIKAALPRIQAWLEDELPFEPQFVPEMTDDLCMQPGCAAPYTVEYRMTIRGCGHCGHYGPPDETESYHRRFCATHARRGDSDLDDSDDNYTEAGDDRD